MNLWHDVPLGKNAPNEINIIVECPRGSLNKFEIDKETGLIALDRVNYSAAPYPCEYAFAPQTLWSDGDALDIIMPSTAPLFPGILVSVRPVGVMRMNDSGESDDKIIAVPATDKRFDHIKDVSDMPERMLKEYKHFFETYKELKGEPGEYKVIIGEFEGREAAIEAIEQSVAMYNEKFGAE
jgi:inorganic pyrophosphatase